jgi:hypothetical protein
VISSGRLGLPLDNACSEWSRENVVEKLLNGGIMTANELHAGANLKFCQDAGVRSTPSAGDRW